MVQVTNLHIELNGKVIHHGLNLSVAKNEKLAIIGDSGSGKSTLLNVMAGFIPAFKGDITIDGLPLDAQHIHAIRSKMAWLPQDISFTVDEVKDLFYAPYELALNKPLKPKEDELEDIFEHFEISKSLLDKKVNEISGGQKQRVLLASCLLLHKPLLLIDEPTSALDQSSKEKITNYILKQKELTVIAVTHDAYWIGQSDNILKIK